MTITDTELVAFLKLHNVGFFFTPEPLKPLPSTDGIKLYKVNEIHIDEFLSKLTVYIDRQIDE